MSSPSSREEALFADALAQPEGQRGAFLDEACGADAILRARILALLAAHTTRGTVAGFPAPFAAATSGENTGDIIGGYTLRQKLRRPA